MPLKKEEVKAIKQKKEEEENKVVEFFKRHKKNDGTDFFSSQDVAQLTDISVKSATDILETIHTNTLARQPIEFQDKGQTMTMRLRRVEEKGIFYYGATFYKQENKKL